MKAPNPDHYPTRHEFLSACDNAAYDLLLIVCRGLLGIIPLIPMVSAVLRLYIHAGQEMIRIAPEEDGGKDAILRQLLDGLDTARDALTETRHRSETPDPQQPTLLISPEPKRKM